MRPGSPAEGTSSSRVELRLAGAFGVVLAGRELAPGEVGSRKARTLLKLLAVERRGLLSADRIADVLWDAAGGPPAEPGQAVATLVSRLRAVLGPGVIRGGRDGYRLAGEPEVGVDLDAAARYCEHAELRLPAVAAAALAAAGHAAELLAAGTALADEPYAAWADPARAELRALLRRVRLTAAQAALAAGDPDAAARYAEAAMTDDPLDEAACRLSMSAAALAGEPARALLAYAALRARLSEELGADPAPQTRELHLAILRAQSPPGGTAPRTARDTSGDRAIPQRPRLAGRDAEIGVLREAWARAAAGDPCLVVITGEAGIGKTALAAHLEAEAGQDGATVLHTRCYEAEQSLFLQPIVDAVTPAVSRMTGAALRDLLGEHAPVLAALLPDAAAMLGPPPSWRGSPEMERRRSFEAVTAFLSGLAGRNPVLLVVDDLQYAGKSTVEFTHYLSRHLSDGRLLVVVTVRAEDHEQAGAVLAPVATRVELGPLGPAAVAQLSREAGQERLAEAILRRTRGHTLFVVEVVRALAAGDAGVPESLLSAVQTRVRRTGTAAESVLRAGAVLGAAFDPLVLAGLLGLAPAAVLDLCEQALQARLLIVSGRDYEFANDLIREVIYATTPEPARLAHHRRAADLLTSQPEVLARHASAAGDWPRAGRAWALAAEDAMRRYATSDAIALSTQALGAAERGGDEELRVRTLVLRGCAQEAAGAYDAAFGDLTLGAAAARAVGDPRLELRAISELGRSRPWSVKAGGPETLSAARGHLLGLAPHGPDGGAVSGQHQLFDHLEPVAPVEGHVALLGRLQVRRQTLGVAVVENRAHQRRPHPLALPVHRGAERGQVPMGLMRVLALDEREHAHGRRQVARHVGQHGQHGEEAGRPGQQRLAGRGPDSRARVPLGGVAAPERDVVRPHLGAEVGPKSSLTAAGVPHQVAGHRVVPERLGQLVRHGVDVRRHGAANQWFPPIGPARVRFGVPHTRFAYHAGVRAAMARARVPPLSSTGGGVM